MDCRPSVKATSCRGPRWHALTAKEFFPPSPGSTCVHSSPESNQSSKHDQESLPHQQLETSAVSAEPGHDGGQNPFVILEEAEVSLSKEGLVRQETSDVRLLIDEE